MFELSDRRFCYHDGIRAVRYHLTHRHFFVWSWDGIFSNDYRGIPLTHATHAGIVAQLYGVDLTPQ